MADFFDLSKNIPDYLKLDFFQKIFKNVKILKFDIKSASNPGDNFIGAVYRVNLETDAGKQQFVIKVPSNSKHENLHLYLSDNFVEDLFNCEISMYEDVLPEILKLWKSADYEDILCPNFIYKTLTPHPTIILEDLSSLGCVTLEMPTEDWKASKMVANRLAKFHAASYYLAYEKGKDFSHFRGSVFKNPILTNVIYNMGLEGFIHVASGKPLLCRHVEKLRNLQTELEDRINKVYSPSINGINVLCHNDFHLKNLLFKKNQEGKIEDFYVIDYQLCNFTSPGIDLIYALYYFVSFENRKNRRDEFIKIYYNNFIASLKYFNFTKQYPSLKKLEDELKKCATFEILVAICLTIFYYFDLRTLTAEELDMAEGTMKSKYRMFQNKEFLEMIEIELKEFERKGFL